jgi:molecular chaperone GrpE
MSNEKNKKKIDVLDEDTEDIRKDIEEEKEESSSLESLKAENQKLLNEKEELNNKYLQALAEMQNYRKRADSELSSHLKYASFNVCRELIKVLDNLDRAIDHGSKDESMKAFLDGFIMIRKQFYQELEKEGVKSFEVLGKPFDPNLMTSLAVVNDNTKADGEVVNEFLKGYMYKDRVLRPASVVINEVLEEEQNKDEENN